MSDDKKLKVNPIIEKLSEVAGRDSAVELQGYVGPSEPNVIRLYRSLSMTHYVEIPKDAILHAVETKDDDTGQVKLFVAGSTQMQAVSVEYRPVLAADFHKAVPLYQDPSLSAAECRKIQEMIGTLEEILEVLDKKDPTGERWPGLRGKIQRGLDELGDMDWWYC